MNAELIYQIEELKKEKDKLEMTNCMLRDKIDVLNGYGIRYENINNRLRKKVKSLSMQLVLVEIILLLLI